MLRLRYRPIRWKKLKGSYGDITDSGDSFFSSFCTLYAKMYSFYSNPVPEPASMYDLQQLAQIKLEDDSVVGVYWLSATREVLIHINDEGWYIQPDGNIVESIGAIFEEHPDNMRIKDTVVYEPHGHRVPGDNNSHDHISQCEWSDYACDRMLLQFVLQFLA